MLEEGAKKVLLLLNLFIFQTKRTWFAQSGIK
jgi:hypothetical protein